MSFFAALLWPGEAREIVTKMGRGGGSVDNVMTMTPWVEKKRGAGGWCVDITPH